MYEWCGQDLGVWWCQGYGNQEALQESLWFMHKEIAERYAEEVLKANRLYPVNCIVVQVPGDWQEKEKDYYGNLKIFKRGKKVAEDILAPTGEI